jgi:hypothetical protein
VSRSIKAVFLPKPYVSCTSRVYQDRDDPCPKLPLRLFGFFILVSYTEKIPFSLKIRRFWNLEEVEDVKIAKMQLRPDYGTGICVR